MPSLTEAFKSQPLYLHQPNLDFKSMQEVPDTHAWPSLDDHQPAIEPFDDASVPVIDLEASDLATTMKQIGNACQTWGVFQVLNHGIPVRLLEEVEYQGRRLFSLPTEQKLKALRSPDGISGYGLARISPFFSKFMWSEGFTIVGSPLDHARQLWPHDYTQFCDAVEEYEREMKELAGRLMWLMLGSLGIGKEDVKWAGARGKFDAACGAIQMNSYPACPDPDRAMGLAAHTDSTLLTVLYQSSTSGLQVLRERSNRWVTVPPLAGALVVNVGDLLHILSNGLFPSILHRAVVNRTRHRLSIAYLWGPPSHVKISPFPRLVDADHLPLYRPVTWNEYLSVKAKYFNKALNQIRTQLKGELKDHTAIISKQIMAKQAS